MRDAFNLIDFPVSWAWHRYYETEQGRPDPGPDRSATSANSSPIIQVPEQSRLDPIRAELYHIRKQLYQHVREKKPIEQLPKKVSPKNKGVAL